MGKLFSCGTEGVVVRFLGDEDVQQIKGAQVAGKEKAQKKPLCIVTESQLFPRVQAEIWG